MYPYPVYGQPQQQWLPFPPQQPQVPQISTHFVSSIEEAKNAMADPLCIHLFMDSASGKIYIKKMGDKGVSEFFVYSQEEAPKDPILEINSRLSRLEHFIGGLNDKSVPSDAGAQQSQSVSNSAVTEQAQFNDEAEPPSLPKVATNDWWQKRG